MSKIEDKVIEKITERAARGLEKYGVTMERGDLSVEEWLVHLQEELLDGAVYIERLLTFVESLPRLFRFNDLEKETSINTLIRHHQIIKDVMMDEEKERL